MKALLAFLALYLFALATVPCHDAGECSRPRTEKASHDHEGETEQCPPFCACACCGTVMMSYPFPAEATVMKVAEAPSARVFFYAEGRHTAPRYGIWQPPRIG